MLQKGYGNPYLGSGVEILILTMENLVICTHNMKTESNKLKTLGCKTRPLTKSNNSWCKFEMILQQMWNFCPMVRMCNLLCS